MNQQKMVEKNEIPGSLASKSDLEPVFMGFKTVPNKAKADGLTDPEQWCNLKEGGGVFWAGCLQDWLAQ